MWTPPNLCIYMLCAKIGWCPIFVFFVYHTVGAKSLSKASVAALSRLIEHSKLAAAGHSIKVPHDVSDVELTNIYTYIFHIYIHVVVIYIYIYMHIYMYI